MEPRTFDSRPLLMLNASVLNSIFGGDKETEKKMIHVALSFLPHQLKDIQRLIFLCDTAGLTEKLHGLKAMLEAFGFDAFYNRITEMELHSSLTDPQQLLQLYVLVEQTQLLVNDLTFFSKQEDSVSKQEFN